MDDATRVLDQVYAADGLNLASPVYYENVSSQMKAFIDRNVFRYYHDEWLMTKIVGKMAVVDLAAYVGHNKGAAFLFVNGDRDFRAMRSGRALMAVAPKPKDWYVFAGSHRGPETVAIGRKMDKYWLDWMVKHL